MITLWLAYFICISGCVAGTEKEGNSVYYTEERCMSDARWYAVYWQGKDNELWAYGCKEKMASEPPRLP